MTSPVAVADISFNSTDLTDLTGVMLEKVVRGGPGTLPSVAGQDDEIPGAEGVFKRNRIKRTRTIEITGWVFGVGADTDAAMSDHWTNCASLEATFTPDAAADLAVTLRNGTTYTIEAWPISVDFDLQAPMLSRVSVVLQSTEHDWTAGGS